MISRKKIKAKKGFKAFPWTAVAEDLRRRGNWILVKSTANNKIFERGNERLVAVKLRQDQWKAEYFRAGSDGY